MSIKDRTNAPTAQGAKPSFEQVYHQYLKPVYTVAYSILNHKEDAEDIAHEVFLSYLRLEDSRQIDNLKAYLLQMSHNKALNYLRKKNREELTEDIETISDSLMELSEESPLSDRVEAEILKLPLEERSIFLMHTSGGMKFADIANAMEMSLPAVFRRYQKAIKDLRRALEGEQ